MCLEYLVTAINISGFVKMVTEAPKTILKQCIVVVLFAVAFAYIESAVVVYLRTIFYPDGFYFPLKIFGTTSLWGKYLLTEIGREVATVVVISMCSFLAGRNRQQRSAYFLIIFAVWDIFYYIWLKALIDWPASIMDWDVLFLIPVTWASPVLAPMLASLAMLAFGGIILYLDSKQITLKFSPFEGLGMFVACLIIIVSFCLAGLHITMHFYASYFSWLMFLGGLISAVLLFGRCVLGVMKSKTVEQI